MPMQPMHGGSGGGGWPPPSMNIWPNIRPDRASPAPPREVWDDVDTLVQACHAHGVDRIGDELRKYEQERKRLHVAIKNLEDQITSLVLQQTTILNKFTRLNELLRQAGIDPEILIQTDNIFSEASEE